MKLLIENWRNFLKEQNEQSKFVICIGDSQTEDRKSYAYKIPKDKKYFMAKHGRRTRKMLSLLKKVNSRTIQKTTHAVIWGGTNDIAGSYGAIRHAKNAINNIKAIIETLKKQNPEIQICIITLPICVHNPYNKKLNQQPQKSKIQKSLEYCNEQLKKLKVDNVIDINQLPPTPDYEAWQNNKGVDKRSKPQASRLADGLHPSRELQNNLSNQILQWIGILI